MTIAFPTLTRSAPSSFRWGYSATEFVHESPYGGDSDILEVPGTKWTIAGTWRNLSLADRAALEGFIAKRDLFYFSHPMWPVPRGTARGAGTLSAASQFAETVTLNGLTNGLTLLVGDFIEVQTSPPILLRVLDNAVVSGGVMPVNVAWMLRAAIANGTAFTLAAPRGQFRLTRSELSMPVEPGPNAQGIGDFDLEAIEDFRP